ncbi:GNAT family N-acetyltransferase [Sulfobacillus harzensis]|uniref:GNAT family N-acetyltransferase n=1 Tax=Sulfobacillus harzensis TaxID=2729629 RepID=A0A7Y0L1X3_9FIRM|nr:GNAT family N-acetyltransferase [Sulfobacillus harzensis]NMP21788.1 GNAT family N-acetyltransferase [Sulfobacillus harzensis]
MSALSINDRYHDRQGGDYLVRDARAADADALITLLDQVGREEIFIADERAQLTAAQEAEIIQRRDPETGVILVVEQNQEVVGSLEMIRGTFHKNRHTAIFGMALLPNSRGRGLGEGLLTSAERWARMVGVKKISLAVFATNLAAIRLYQRLGYQEEGRRRGQYLLRDHLVDEIWMAHWL